MTRYLVFKRPLDGDPERVQWEPVGEFDGHTTKAAVTAAILAMSDDDKADAAKTIFAATPSGSWREHAPNVKVETKVSF